MSDIINNNEVDEFFNSAIQAGQTLIAIKDDLPIVGLRNKAWKNKETGEVCWLVYEDDLQEKNK